MIPASFFTELEKTAISMGRTLAAVQRRIGQGASVGARSLSELEAGAAKGLSSTPRAARRTALYAAEGGRDAAKMQQAVNNPVTAATRARLNEGSAAARSGRPGVHDMSRPLPDHYDHGPNPDAGFAYTRGHIDRMAGASQIHDPKGLIAQSDRVHAAMSKTMPPPPSGTAVTAVSGAGLRPMGQTAISRPAAARRVARPASGNTAVTAITGDNGARSMLQQGTAPRLIA